MNNPFDFSQFFPKYDAQDMLRQMQSQFQSQMQAAFGAFTPPQSQQIDFSSITEAQRKNMEALIASNTKAVECTQSLLQKQSELFQQAMNDASKASEAIAKTTDPAEAATKQTELMQSAFEKALESSSQISELISKTQEDMTKIISERVEEGLAEIKKAIKT